MNYFWQWHVGSSSWGVSEPRAGMFPDEGVLEDCLSVTGNYLVLSFQEYLNYLVVEVLFIRKVRIWRNDRDWC